MIRQRKAEYYSAEPVVLATNLGSCQWNLLPRHDSSAGSPGASTAAATWTKISTPAAQLGRLRQGQQLVRVMCTQAGTVACSKASGSTR